MYVWQVCENDTVIVDVTNAMDRELLTVHWHGLHQVGTQYMDGAPYITQCPITPGDSFRYEFLASPHGTHIWHGHVGKYSSYFSYRAPYNATKFDLQLIRDCFL